MIDSKTKANVSVELEAIVGTLKTDGDEDSANRLHELAMAVKDGPFADAWAATNIHQMIDVNSIVERYRKHLGADRSISWLEWIRNALIFAPLVVTWFYISRSVDAYSRLIHDDPDQIRI